MARPQDRDTLRTGLLNRRQFLKKIVNFWDIEGLTQGRYYPDLHPETTVSFYQTPSRNVCYHFKHGARRKIAIAVGITSPQKRPLNRPKAFQKHQNQAPEAIDESPLTRYHS